MGANLELEVNTGDVLQILRPDGHFGGKAIYAFSTSYAGYRELSDVDSWEFTWFKTLEERTEKDLGLFNRILYSGNWNYDEEDYERFQKCEGYLFEISKEDFLKAIIEVQNMWTPIDTVFNLVDEL